MGVPEAPIVGDDDEQGPGATADLLGAGLHDSRGNRRPRGDPGSEGRVGGDRVRARERPLLELPVQLIAQQEGNQPETRDEHRHLNRRFRLLTHSTVSPVPLKEHIP